MHDAGLASSLRDGLEALGIALGEAAQGQLLDYIALLDRWNRSHNLTSVRGPQAMLPRHVLDSLSVAAYLRGERILDLGTGPGLPGLVLAVAYPEREFLLLDANRKKTGFCLHAAGSLGLANVRVAHARAESLRVEKAFDTAVSRAFGPLARICGLCAPLLAPGGRILAMKGRRPEAELSELGPMGENARVIPLSVPSLDAVRHLVVIDGRADTPWR